MSHPLFLLGSSLFFSFFLTTSYGDDKDSFAGNCPSYPCGNVSISYPFWRIDTTTSTSQYCGYPGLGLKCSSPDQQLILDLSNNSYNVRNINYDQKNLNLTSINVTGNQSCPRVRNNLTLDTNNVPLFHSQLDLELSFYFNCTEYPKDILRIPPIVPCLKSGVNESFVFVAGKEPVGADWLYDSCEEKVVTKVLHRENIITNLVTGLGMNDGFVLNWTTLSACGACEESHGRCGYNNSDIREVLCFCPDGTTQKQNYCKKGTHLNWGLKMVIGFVAAGISMMLTCILPFFIFWRNKRNETSSYRSIIFWRKKRNDNRNLEAFIKSYGSLSPKRYSYSDIKKMTNTFRDKLGQGGYGCVYRGKLLDNRLVAVKLLDASKGNGEEFINEVASISRTSHVNVVTLLGFCLEGRKRALIYQFMPNGSLEKFIYGEGLSKTNGLLGWENLYQVTIGIARGLEYLHRGCNQRILHLDIKPHNILLDEDFCPKISDFGLAKLCTKKESIISMLEARGTIGYIAPEVFSRNFGGVSHKSDVYSYGMMVLEMVGGRKNADVGASHTSKIYFPHWVYKRLELDEEVGFQGDMTEEENEMARKMMFVGLWCIQADPSQRPSMTKVLEMLEGSIEALEIPPRPYLYSPSRSPADSSTT